MKILLAADGRSPITRGWIRLIRKVGFEVSLVSTFPCAPVDGVDEMVVIPAAFSSMAGSQAGDKGDAGKNRVRGTVSKFRGALMLGRYWLGPLSLKEPREQFLEAVDRIKPDIVHALRIPFEGMLARVTPPEIPFLVSIWGNDLTLHAKGSPLMDWYTRSVLKRADGLMADAKRDLRLSLAWGLREGVPTLSVPGGGGIDRELIQSAVQSRFPLPLELPADVPVVINPRGFRPGSVRNDTFFKAIPDVVRDVPEAVFVCPGMAGQPDALRWVKRLEIESSVHLLPFLPQKDLWRLFKRAMVSVSISQHDGTPNSLLEAMALGCFPVVGEIESTREWIIDGVNGYLVDPGHAPAVAQMIVRAIKNPPLRAKAQEKNSRIILERADSKTINPIVSTFYEQVLAG
jgi:glycosyltransferase involved in cell wall biosynthesis